MVASVAILDKRVHPRGHDTSGRLGLGGWRESPAWRHGRMADCPWNPKDADLRNLCSSSPWTPQSSLPVGEPQSRLPLAEPRTVCIDGSLIVAGDMRERVAGVRTPRSMKLWLPLDPLANAEAREVMMAFAMAWSGRGLEAERVVHAHHGRGRHVLQLRPASPAVSYTPTCRRRPASATVRGAGTACMAVPMAKQVGVVRHVSSGRRSGVRRAKATVGRSPGPSLPSASARCWTPC
jgi:hypothetical protein